MPDNATGGVVDTIYTRLAAAMTRQAVTDGTSIVITASTPGVGTTTTGRHACAATGQPVWAITASRATTPIGVNADLLRASDARPTPPNWPVHTTTEALTERTAAYQPIAFIDRADRLSIETLGHLEMLERRCGLTICYTTTSARRPTPTHRELADRAERYVVVEPLATADMIDALTQLDPIYHQINAADLVDIDEHHAHGRWRRWAQFTRALHHYTPTGHTPQPTNISNALTALAWNQRPTVVQR